MTTMPLLRGGRASSRRAGKHIAQMLTAGAALALSAAFWPAYADHIVMQNGDHYYGRVLSLTTNSLLLQSEVLGNVNLPRDKVKLVNFGINSPPRAAATADTNAVFQWPAAVRELRSDTNLVRQVQAEYLGGATPEAHLKFHQTLNGLVSGQLTVNDLRAEARSAAEQLRSFKRELGGDAGDELDGYLTILERFLRETEASDGAPAKSVRGPSRATNAPASPRR
jgi:hypothetical protein